MMLLDECLPMGALSLGSLVESIRNPIMDAYVPKSPLPSDAVLTIAAKSFQGLMSSSNAASFRVSLTRLFDVGGSSENGAEASLHAMQVNRYVLKQPREIFRAMCLGDEKARQYLNEGIQAGNKSYLVVELQTATNPMIKRSDTKKSSSDANVTVPVSTIATGGADVLGLGSSLDTSVGVGRSISNESSKTFETEGETIFAVGYKKVTWKSWGFKRKEVEKAVLDKEITWSMLGQKRSRDDEDEQVSVDLVDSLDAKPKDGGAEGDEEENDEDDDDEILQLLQNGVEVDGQTYLLPSANDEE